MRPDYQEGAPVVTVIVDPYRRTVVDVFDPLTMSAGEKAISWQRALHYGIGLGGTYKFLVFLSGVIIPIFAVTGFLMWWIKRRNRRAGERARQAILQGAGQAAE
ncbi:PepSY domain-containing protein [Reyranella sp.]|uniref:PepSY domain-containing protein n=1 Tax=Reyranella sp. TaxID=1929291 RepID=UPI003C7D1499